MEDYSTDSLVLAFTRFACRFGYPKRLLPDEGSQLVKACKNMIISFSTIQHKLKVEYGVEFETCPWKGGAKNPANKKVIFERAGQSSPFCDAMGILGIANRKQHK